MNRIARLAVVCAGVFAVVLATRGSIPEVLTGKWSAGSSLGAARSGATATALPDGRILVVGGTDTNGAPLASAEYLNPDGSFSSAGSMSIGRTRHAAILLPDGDVLVAGGQTSGGGFTNNAELLDPLSGAWTTVAASMADARAGHTMSVLPDYTVAIVGGENSTGPLSSIELFDEAANSFTFAGTLQQARKDHAAAVLNDGRVLISGGSGLDSGGNPAILGSTEIYTMGSGVSAGPALNTARTRHSATTLLDGTVLIAAGSAIAADPAAGMVDLASAEIFDPAANSITALPVSLATPRSGHVALLLPNNNNVVFVGGNSNGVAVASVEMYTPWLKQFSATGPMNSARAHAAGAAFSEGLLNVAGGTDAGGNVQASSEWYRFTTVKTDALDYPPGTTVHITGTGWQPGETVTLSMVESPLIDAHGPYTVVADQSGNISDTSFVTDVHDLDVKFTLTAVGSSSALQARTAFTDANANDGDGSMVLSPATALAASTGNTLTFTFSSSKTFNSGAQIVQQIPAGFTAPQTSASSNPGFVSFGGSGGCTATLGISGSGPWQIAVNITASCTGFTLTYAGGGAKVTMPTTAGAFNGTSGGTSLGTGFTAQSKNSGGTLKNLGPPAASQPAFTVAPGPATHLAFGTQPPSNAVTGQSLGSVTVQVLDANNNVVTGSSAPVTMTIANNPGSATLSGTTTVNASSGIATFANLSVNKVANGYTLQASSGSLTSAISSTFNITPAGTTVSVSSPGAITYGSSVTFTATVSVSVPGSGTPTGTVDFFDGATNIGSGTLSGTTATFSTSAMNAVSSPHSITAKYNGDANFNASAASSAFSQVVNKKVITASITANDKIYDGTNSATFSCSLNGVLAGDAGNVSCTGGSATFSQVTVGSNLTVSATGLGINGAAAGNYTLSPTTATGTANITKATLTVSGVTANNKTYDGTTAGTLNTGGAALVGVVGGDHVNLQTSGAAGTFADKNVANNKSVSASGFSINGPDSGNYTLTQPTGLTANITPATLTYVADAKTRAYGAADPAFTGSVTGFVTGDTLANATTGTLAFSSSATATSNVGSYAVNGSGLTANNGNYTFVQAAGNATALTITKAHLTVTADPQSRQYGDANPTLTSTISGFANGETLATSGVTGSASCTTTAVATSSVTGGPYPITCTQGTLAAGNYDFTTFNPGNLTITKAHLTVSADDKSRGYGDANPALTASLTGLKNGENVTSAGVTGSANLSTAATATSSVAGSPYAITVVDAGTLSAANYDFPAANFVNGQLTITKAHLTVTADNKSRGYGDANPALTATLSGFKNSETTATAGVTGSANLSTTATPSSSVAGSPYAITVVDAGTLSAFNYDFPAANFVNGQLTITKALLTVTADPQARIYGDANPTLTSTLTGFANSETLATSGVTGSASCTTSAVATSSVAGSPYPITCTQGSLAAGNYDFPAGNFIAGQLTINQRPATITADGKTKNYGDVNPALTATVSGTVNGDTLNYTLSTTAVQFSNVGSYPITVSLGSNPNYSITSANGTLTVNQRPATVTADPQSKNYGDVNPTLTATVAGTVNGEMLSYTLATTAVQFSSVGSYPITVSLGSNPNYSITPANGALTVNQRPATVTADAKSKTYGDVNPTLTATVTGTVNGDTLNYTLSTTAVQFSGVGSYSITVTLGSNPNYSITPTNGMLTVNQRPATVAADAKSKNYGDVNPALTATVTGTVNGDTLNYTLATTAVQFSNVGSYPISVTLGSNPNYSITPTNGTLTVNQRPATVTADPQSKNYGDLNPTLTATVTGTVNGDTLNYTLSTTAVQFSNVGSYPITVTLGSNPNYSITPTNGTLTVNQRPATVTADPQSKNYGDLNPALTATVTGMVNGDTLNYTLSTTAVQFSSVGPYPITVSLGSNPNYSITPTNGTLTVNQRPATVTADPQNKNYGDVNPTLTATVAGAVNGDTLSYTLSTTAVQFSNVGSYPITVSLGSNPNYIITPANGTLTVNQRPATVTADPQSKNYGDVNPALTATVTGTVNGDTLSYTLATTAVQFSSVGSYPITVTLGSNPNYSITPANGALTVNQRPATVTADAKSKTYGDVNPTLTATVTGTVNGDTLNYTLSTTAVQFSGVGSYPITVILGSNPNYSVTPSNGSLTIIQRDASVTPNAATKVYGSADPPLTGTLTNFVASDAVTATYSRTAGETVAGSPYTISATLSPAAVLGNYNIIYNTAKFTINKAATATSVVTSQTPTIYGALVSFTATVTDVTPGSSGTPTGTVTFVDGAIAIGTGSLSGNTAVFSTFVLPPGANSITAAYNGDGNFTASASSAITQTVTAAPIVSLDPSSITFPGQDVGTRSAAMPVVLTNIGTATLNISHIQIGGSNPDDFNLASNSCGQTLAQGSSCSVTLTFNPRDTGIRSATLIFTDNDGGSVAPVSQYIGLTGSALSAVSADFTKQSIAANNTIWFNSVFSVKGPNGDDGRELNMSSAKIQVFVTNGSVSFTGNNGLVTLPVPDALITFDPAATQATTTYDPSKNLWRTTVPAYDQKSGKQHFDVDGEIFSSGMGYLVPAGGLPGGIKNVTWSASYSTDTPGIKLKWEWGAAVYTSFNADLTKLGVKPVDDGKSPSLWSNTDRAATPENYTQYMTLGATADDKNDFTGDFTKDAGVIPSVTPVTISPSPVVFAAPVAAGASSSPMAVTVTNNNLTLALYASSVAISGDFAVTGATAPCSIGSFTLAPGASCTFNVTFTPTDLGTRTGALSFTYAAPAGMDQDDAPPPQKVDLFGTGAGGSNPIVGLSQVSLNFGYQKNGTSSSPQTVMLVNAGGGTLTLNSIAASGDYSQTTTCGTSLAPGANCTISVTFNPTVVATRTGAITITDNNNGAPNSVQTIALTGKGTP